MRERFRFFKPFDYLQLAVSLFAIALIVAIIISYIAASTTQLSSYETPIPLTSEKYKKSDIVAGFFKGQKLYNGSVEIQRQISCSNGFIETLPDLVDGDTVVHSIGKARKVDGELPRNIARVPEGVAVGSSCYIVFSHTACVPYLFGCDEVEYSYVSEPFIVEDGAPTVEQSKDPPLPQSDKGLTAPAINKDQTNASGITGASSSPTVSSPLIAPQTGNQQAAGPLAPIPDLSKRVNDTVEGAVNTVTYPVRQLFGI